MAKQRTEFQWGRGDAGHRLGGVRHPGACGHAARDPQGACQGRRGPSCASR